jgi:MFS family permease
MASDWLQGPYVYALYKSYGLSIDDISMLFIAGFGSSMVMGTFVGAISDKYGRKRLALVFGVLYSVSCLTKLSPEFHWLMVGRLTGGVATSLLFSVFEAWMVYEHTSRGFDPEWIGQTFGKCHFGNGVVAIVSGLVASFVASRWGPVAPFMVSLALLVVVTAIIFATWTENYGDSTIELYPMFVKGAGVFVSDRRVLLLGIVQSCFEGAMYSFVFWWNPLLNQIDGRYDWQLGVLFACFMLCVMIGSTVYSLLVSGVHKSESIGVLNYALAAAALVLPAVSSSPLFVVLGFLVFEFTCGVYFPCQGVLRSRYIPEESRASVMNIYRIPLNAFVLAVITSGLGERSVFYVASCALAVASFAQHLLAVQSNSVSAKLAAKASADHDEVRELAEDH